MTDSDRQLFREALSEIVDNQMRSCDPPQTREAYDRLIADGYSKEEARALLAAAVGHEIQEMLKEMKPFDRKRFVQTLRGLPNSVATDEK